MEKVVEKIWERYNTATSETVRSRAANDLVAYYMPFVEKIVDKMASGFPAHVDKDDLMSEGLIGLYDAIQKYEEQGYKFETYASWRIRGAVIDHIRHTDWATRSFRKRSRELDEAVDHLTVSYGRTPSEEDIIEYLGISSEEYQEVLSENVTSAHLHYDQLQLSEGDTGSFAAWDVLVDVSSEESFIEFEEPMVRLADTVDEELTPLERAVMALYYDKGLSLKEIGDMLDVTESRACQIHTKSLDKIRTTWSVV